MTFVALGKKPPVGTVVKDGVVFSSTEPKNAAHFRVALKEAADEWEKIMLSDNPFQPRNKFLLLRKMRVSAGVK